MPNTVDLSTLVVDPKKQLSLVKAGQITMAEYIEALKTVLKISGEWVSADEYLIDFAQGIKDPLGENLTVEEVLEVIKGLMPSPLRSAGKSIVLRGPTIGIVAAQIARTCYAADLYMETVDKATFLTTRRKVGAFERDRVRLVRPDTNETTRQLNNGWLHARTSQLNYKRRDHAPGFDYHGTLQLVFLEINERLKPPSAKILDQYGNYAWVDNLSNLEDVQ